MAKVTEISEHLQHFLAEMKESFWGICMGRRKWSGSGFSSCNRSGSGTGTRCERSTSAGGTSISPIAMDTTSGIL